MRVGVDATMLRPGHVGGVRTATYLLLDALRRYAPEVDLVALAPGPAEAPPGVRTVATGGPQRPLFWRRSRALRDATRELDLFHSPYTAFPFLKGPALTATVHELPFVVNARLEGIRRAMAQLYWFGKAIAHCRALVAPTHATLRQMRLAHPSAGRFTAVVPHPAPPAPAEEQKQHDGSLLFVGRLDKRKCVEMLLAGAVGTEGQIRLAGPHDADARHRIGKAARKLGLEKRLLWLGQVNAETLDYLYRNACVLGLVSVSEGFGFPVLEALARGVPVVVAAETGAAEVGGDAVLAVDPTDRDGVHAALVRAADPDYRDEVRRKGPARTLEFTPERTARGYLEVFERALAD